MTFPGYRLAAASWLGCRCGLAPSVTTTTTAPPFRSFYPLAGSYALILLPTLSACVGASAMNGANRCAYGFFCFCRDAWCGFWTSPRYPLSSCGGASSWHCYYGRFYCLTESWMSCIFYGDACFYGLSVCGCRFQKKD